MIGGKEMQGKRIISYFLVFCMVLSACFMLNNVAFAQGETDTNVLNLCGVWTGTYVGYSGSTEIKRVLRLDIDYASEEKIEGIATIDEGENGSYFFDGRINTETGEIKFSGTDWIENPSNFSFGDFFGQLSDSKIEGTVDNNDSRTFSLIKQSNAYVTKRISINSIPKDWQGEYDGHHGSTVVRRDYEIHIQSIDSDGNIKGTGIISPSEKADADLGANGSYFFAGTIDSRRGKINLQGNEWIEYPASSNYSDWSFVKLEGYFDLASASISGESEDGIWEMNAINYDSIKTLSGFTLGRDNNNYCHTSNSARNNAGFAGVTDYSIDTDYFEKLTKNSSKGEKNSIKKQMNDSWDGSCYGIAMSMGLLYEGYISLADLTDSKKSNYFTLNYPYKDKKFLNMINYYQLSQNLENGGKQSAAVSASFNNGIFTGLTNWINGYDSLPVFLKKLVKYCDNNHVELMGYSTSKSGHAVLITGCEFDSSLNKYKVQVYDENCIDEKGQKGSFSYMYIDKDYSNFEYTDANGHKLNKRTYNAIFFLDWNSLGSVVSNSAEGYSGHTKIDFPVGQKFKMEDENGNYLIYDGEKFSGNIEIYGIDTIDYDNGSRFVIVTGSTGKLTFTEIGNNIDINATIDNSFMGLTGKSINKAVIDFNDGIKVDGKNFDYTAYVTTDEVTDDEKGLISVSGKSKSEVDIAPDGTGVSVETDGNLAEIKTETFVGSQVIEKKFKNVGKKFTIDKNAKVKTVKTSLSNATVKLSKVAYTYDGKTKKPAVTVKLNGKKLKNGKDYTLTYKNNKKVGTASVVITGKGGYKGKITKKFKINPKGTVLTKVKAKKKKMTVKWKKQTKLTKGYQIQYSTSKKFKGAKSVLVTKNKKTSITIKNLKSKKKYFVRIRTYKIVKGKKYYSKWSKVKSVKIK